jgi:hypothetical protein
VTLAEIEHELKSVAIAAEVIVQRLETLHQRVAALLVEAHIAGERVKRRDDE